MHARALFMGSTNYDEFILRSFHDEMINCALHKTKLHEIKYPNDKYELHDALCKILKKKQRIKVHL